MEKKVIYVDFKAASRKYKHKNDSKVDQVKIVKQQKSYVQLLIFKLKKILSIFSKHKSNNNEDPRYKHWL